MWLTEETRRLFSTAPWQSLKLKYELQLLKAQFDRARVLLAWEPRWNRLVAVDYHSGLDHACVDSYREVEVS